MSKKSLHIIMLVLVGIILGSPTAQALDEKLTQCKADCNRKHPNKAYENCKQKNNCKNDKGCKDKCKELKSVKKQNVPYDMCIQNCM